MRENDIDGENKESSKNKTQFNDNNLTWLIKNSIDITFFFFLFFFLNSISIENNSIGISAPIENNLI